MTTQLTSKSDPRQARALMPLLLDSASRPYKPAGEFAWRFARGKLSGDPAFMGLLRHGLIPDEARVLDLGCGQGLLAAWLTAARAQYEASLKKQGRMGKKENAAPAWPVGWPAAPRLKTYDGIELMGSDVARANAALGLLRLPTRFISGDICDVPFAPCDAVVILDVLHYIGIDAQDAVLARVRDALAPKGVLLLRIGDAAGGLPFKISNWVDHVVTFARGHRLPKLYCRTLAQWQDKLRELGFQVQTMPMHEGTPFANILLVAKLS